jgi:hypothetical protein
MLAYLRGLVYTIGIRIKIVMLPIATDNAKRPDKNSHILVGLFVTL